MSPTQSASPMPAMHGAAPVKLVLAGPMGAGKSTTIRSITDSELVSTDMPMSQGATAEKSTTTVALDFAPVALEDGTPLLVYGLPGQERFDFMRPILIRGAFGVAIVLDGSDPELEHHCRHWLLAVRAIDDGMPIAIGITHTDLVPGFDLGALRRLVRGLGRAVPLFTFDARDRGQSLHLVRALLLAG